MFGKDVNSLNIYHRDAVGGKLSPLKTISGERFYATFIWFTLTWVLSKNALLCGTVDNEIEYLV